MYKLYTDRPTDFKCHIELEGAAREEVDARLIIESKDKALLYRGTISRSGECAIPVGELKGLMSAGTIGTMTLEVVMGETYFQPWKTTFKVQASRKIRVEVFDPTTKKQNVSVSVEEQDDLKAARVLAEQFKNSGITPENALKKRNRRYIKEIVTHFVSRHPNVDSKELVSNAIRLLAE